MKKVAAYTLGCKVNQYETEAVLGNLVSSGFTVVDFNTYADVYVVNTCTVTGLADRKCRQIIRKAKKVNPQAIVVAMGCYSQVAPDEVAKLSDVNLILGTDGRKRLPAILNSGQVHSDTQLILIGDIMEVREFEELGLDTYTEHTRAFLKIQDGCDRFCSYCIIPYARGRVRSRAPQQILEEIMRLAENGFKEFVLTGIHLASYGKDLKNQSLTQIIRAVSELAGVERIRLGSIEPMTITSEFLQLLSDSPKLCPHFHISLQSGSDTVLQRMNRKYTAGEYQEKCRQLQQQLPGAALTTDIIVGFPGETEEEFTETLQFAKTIGFSKIHVFPFSPRAGTKAAEMEGQISSEMKQERSDKLIALSDWLAAQYGQKMLNKKLKVLVERKAASGTAYEGHAENYLKVVFSAEDRLLSAGDIAEVLITGRQGESLEGILQ